MRTGKMIVAVLLVAVLSFATLVDAPEASAEGGSKEGYGDSDTMSASYREVGGDGLIDITLKVIAKASTVNVSVAGQSMVVPAAEINIGVSPLGVGNHPILITENGTKLAECILTVVEYFTVTVTDDGNGTATGGGKYAVGSTVTLSDSPSTGYEFDGWQVVSGDVTITDNKFEMPASDVAVKAVFKQATYDVTISVKGSGSVSKTSVPAVYGASISASGATLTIGSETVTATAGSGYSFSGWVGIPQSKTVTGNLSVTAYFVQDSPGPTPEPPVTTTYRVTVETDGNGTASASPSSATAGTTITLTATPNEGFVFKEWQTSSGITITGNTFTMPSKNVTVKAIFEKPTVTVDVSFDRTIASLNVGDTTTIKATVTPADAPDKGLVWTSSDPSVVTVDDGVITAVGPGTAKVTATTVSGKTATCTVTVILPDVVIEADDGQISGSQISGVIDQVYPGQNVILDAKGSDSLTIDVDSVDALLEKGAIVTIDTDSGSVEIPKGSLVGVPTGQPMVVTLTGTEVPSIHTDRVPEGSVVVDVTITVGDMVVTTFGTPITVSIPVGDGYKDTSKLSVYHLADDGTMTDMNATYDAATHSMVFQTGHLSVYAIVEASDEPAPSEDNDSTMLYIGIAVVILVVIVLAAVLVTRRRY